VSLPSSIVDVFVYNGDSQRVQKQDSTGTTKHVWDGQNIVLETDSSNIIQVVYTLEPILYGNLISQRRGGVTSFYLFDAQGSTRQLANSTGSVTDTYLYDPFGNSLLQSGATVNGFRYIGKLEYYYDADISMYYIRLRFYNSGVSAFASRDRSDQSSTLVFTQNVCSDQVVFPCQVGPFFVSMLLDLRRWEPGARCPWTKWIAVVRPMTTTWSSGPRTPGRSACVMSSSASAWLARAATKGPWANGSDARPTGELPWRSSARGSSRLDGGDHHETPGDFGRPLRCARAALGIAAGAQ
jgi:hypothetical protein